MFQVLLHSLLDIFCTKTRLAPEPLLCELTGMAWPFTPLILSQEGCGQLSFLQHQHLSISAKYTEKATWLVPVLSLFA